MCTKVRCWLVRHCGTPHRCPACRDESVRSSILVQISAGGRARLEIRSGSCIGEGTFGPGAWWSVSPLPRVGPAQERVAAAGRRRGRLWLGPSGRDPLRGTVRSVLRDLRARTALYSAALVSTGGFGRPARAARKRGRAPVTLADRAGPQRDLYVFAVGRGARDRHRLHRSVRLDIQDSKNQPGGPTC